MNEKLSPRLIVFDWDDVLTLGSIAGYTACYHQALLELGIELHHEEEARRIKSQWGKPHEVVLSALLDERPELVENAATRYERHLFGATFVSHLDVVPNARETIERLAANYPLAVVTGMHPVLLTEQVIPKFGFPSVFRDIVSSYELDPALVKPSPHAVLMLSEKHGIEPSSIIVVGDSEGDMRMAISAGATPVAVLTGHLSAEQAVDLGVEHVVADVTHLEQLVTGN